MGGSRRPGRPRRGLHRGERGQGAVEFLLALPMVLFLLSGVFEFGRHYYTRLTLRHAVSDAARFAVTGNVLTDSATGQPLTRVQSIVHTLLDRAADLNIDVSQLTITPSDGGGPGEVVTIAVTYRYRFVLAPIARLFGPGYLDFTVATSVMNEPRW